MAGESIWPTVCSPVLGPVDLEQINYNPLLFRAASLN